MAVFCTGCTEILHAIENTELPRRTLITTVVPRTEKLLTELEIKSLILRERYYRDTQQYGRSDKVSELSLQHI